jgi:mannosyltransferase OCH1-like enzyme
VDGLLTDGQFPKQVSKKEVQQWIKDAKATSQESVPTIHWQAWSTNAVASKASIFLSACSSKQS